LSTIFGGIHRLLSICLHVGFRPQVEQICDQCAMEPRNCGYTNTWPPGTLFGEFGGFSYDAVPSARNTYGRYDPYPKCYLDYCIIGRVIDMYWVLGYYKYYVPSMYILSLGI